MKKRILPILLIFTIFLPGLVFYPNQTRAADPAASAYDYYGYTSRRIVIEALASHAEIPDYKRAALVNKLSTDGYFWLKTKKEKLDYIHANLAANKYLTIVADAEDVHSWTVNTTEASEVSSKMSEEAQKEILAEATRNYQEWVSFYLSVTKYEGERYEWGDQAVFYKKNLWSKANLDRLYDYYWPDLKKNRASKDFTPEERKRIDQIWAAGHFNDILKKLPRLENPSSAGFTGDTYWDDILMFIPVEKLFSWLLKPAGKILIKGAERVGSRVADNVAVAGGKRVVQKIADHSITWTSRFLGDVTLNLSKMFARSSLSKIERESVSLALTRTVSRIMDHPLYGKYFSKELGRDVLEKLRVVTSREAKKSSSVYEWAGYCRGSKGNLEEVVLNEVALKDVGSDIYNATLAHETFHAASEQPAGYLRKYYSKLTGGSPLYEGTTEALSQIYLKDEFGHKIILGSYKHETEVSIETMWAIERKYGKGTGQKYMAKIYFEEGMPALDRYLGKGVHDTLHNYMLKGDFDGAIKYLKSTKF